MSCAVEINDQFALRDAGCSNGDHGASMPRHRWYEFKEAFSPRIVTAAIQDAACGAGDLVVDPFCGSGTVPLVAAESGLCSVGIEVNPFLAFVARTKLANASADHVNVLAKLVGVAASAGARSPLESYSTFCRGTGKRKWLFNRSVLRAFEGAWVACEGRALPVADVLRLALLGAAMDACNATRDGKCLRYRADWEAYRLGARDFAVAFRRRVDAIAEDVAASRVDAASVVIVNGDSRAVVKDAIPRKFRLCVTSPPYLNSFDYSDVYRPELFLGKFVGSTDELRELRLRTVRSHVQVGWSRPTLSEFGEAYAGTMRKIKRRSSMLWDHRIPSMIQAYFEDMRTLLVHLRERARDDASVWIVVSTSAYAGVEVPVDVILADIGEANGWKAREIGLLRHLRTAGQHWRRWKGPSGAPPRLRESVVILDARK